MMRRLLLPVVALLAACSGGPTDTAQGDEPDTPPVVLMSATTQPGELPASDTEIGQRARGCSKPNYCGDVGFTDCGAAIDGPTFYFSRTSGKIISVCGGACWRDPDGRCKRECPPPAWTCRSKGA